MLSIIIPNYNGLEHLKICYESLKNQTLKDFTLILVDNGSSDDSVRYTADTFPESVTIKLNYNSGFAKAVNRGIIYISEYLNCKYILLLNNDIELRSDFLKAGIDTFQRDSEVSFIATKMLNYYERDKIDDCGDFIKKNGGSPYARGNGEKDTGQYEKGEFIFGASAGAAFYKKILFEKVGLFDEQFFAYYEDIDFSFRAQLMGFKCYYQPKAVCYHKRGGTSSIAKHGFQTELCERNLLLLRIKNYPLWIYIIYQPLFLIARLKRYYSFIRFYSFAIFLRALKGYIRGLLISTFQLPKRFKIQRSRTVPVSYIKSLFIR